MTTRNRIFWFFVLACALSWAGYLGNAIWPSEHWPGQNPLGPLVAALIMIPATEGWSGLQAWGRRLVRFRAPARVYLAAFFIPLAIIALSFGATIQAGATLAPLPAHKFADLAMMLPLAFLFGPGPEEMSFRGHGLDALQQVMSPLAASLWVGFGVIVWHAPLMITGDLPVTVLLPLTGVAVVYGWLYQTGRSVWPLILLHLQLNYVAGTITGPMMLDFGDQSLYLALLGLFYLVWAGYLVLVHGKTLGRAPSPDALPLPV